MIKGSVQEGRQKREAAYGFCSARRRRMRRVLRR